jgi:undecaprenyl-diphosphatase
MANIKPSTGQSFHRINRIPTKYFDNRRTSKRKVERMSQGLSRAWNSDSWPLVSILIIAALLFIFGLIAEEVAEGEALGFDRAVLLALRDAADPSRPIGPPWLLEAARDVTSLGSTVVIGLILIAVVGYFLLDRERATAWLMLGAVVGGVALNDFLKFLFARPRPDFVAPAVRVFTSSFPSGHAALSAITYLAFGAILARTHASARIRVYFMSLAVIVTGLVGVSRVYLGVHYPTDVLAGWCVGTAWAMGCWALMAWLQRRGEIGPPKAI